MKEAPTYRDELEEILRFTGEKRILTVSDVSRYVGKTRDYVRERMGIVGDITAVTLAHKMVSLSSASLRAR